MGRGLGWWDLGVVGVGGEFRGGQDQEVVG